MDRAQKMKAKVDDGLKLANAELKKTLEHCKTEAFEEAMKEAQRRDKLQKERDATIAKVKKDYTAAAAFNNAGADGKADGGVNSLCNYPQQEADKPAVERPFPLTCKEAADGKPLCCGAAHHFMKDGTKLTIETCQYTDTKVYEFFPALPKDALEAPES